MRPLPDDLLGAAASVVERDLTFLGLIALWDPPRPEVADAVALCRGAGIRVIMITGDYGLTAQTIARQIGLPVQKVISGDEMERLSPQALTRLLAEPGVLFARTSPAHKLAIVSALKAGGEVVAVTGDGVNDAPALKAADIGVAMGKRGSEVAKEAAVMVITDDNFASIVTAVRQGRAIYANMGKFVTYIFTHNFAELVAFLAFVLLRIPLPLTLMQVLAIDLVTDLFPALALGAEPPEPGVMHRPPHPKGARLLGARRLLHAYGFLGPAEAAFSLGAFFWTYWLAGWRPGLPMAAAGPLYRRATTMTLSAHRREPGRQRLRVPDRSRIALPRGALQQPARLCGGPGGGGSARGLDPRAALVRGVQHGAAVVSRMGRAAHPASGHAPPRGRTEVAGPDRSPTEGLFMTTLSFYRAVIEETGQTDREAVKRGTAAVLHALRDRLTPRRLARQRRSCRAS